MAEREQAGMEELQRMSVKSPEYQEKRFCITDKSGQAKGHRLWKWLLRDQVSVCGQFHLELLIFFGDRVSLRPKFWD